MSTVTPGSWAGPGESEHVIGAVIENRAKELGMAMLDLSSWRVHLLQLIETSRGYPSALSVLDIYQPSKLILCGSSALDRNQGHLGFHRAARKVSQVQVPRSMFDDTKGAALLGQFASADPLSRVDFSGMRGSRYLALGAAGAVLQYAQTEHGLHLVPHCVRAEFVDLSEFARVDAGTAAGLELVAPMSRAHEGRGGRSRGAGNRPECLLDVVDGCKTKPGSRMARANLLQPLRDVRTINKRLNAVEELSGIANTVVSCLAQLPADLDRVCGNLVQLASTPSPGAAHGSTASAGALATRVASCVSSAILLREVLRLLPALCEALDDAESSLLQAIRDNFLHPDLALLETALNDVIDEDVHSSRQSFMNRTNQCFAVNATRDPFLELSRSLFCRVTERTHQLVEEYRKLEGMSGVRLGYGIKKGFFLQVNAGEEGLPVPFRVLRKAASGAIVCTTPELMALNKRLRESGEDCMLLSLKALEALLADIRPKMYLLHGLIDSIALLDMLCAFATISERTGRPYTRPMVTVEGPLAIQEGRHPIAELRVDGAFQSNSVFMSEAAAVHIIGGANMSGKSTFLRQVGCIAILAQIGCLVPASFASVRITDKFLSRFGSSDSIEANASSFTVEMQEVAAILQNCTASSLVLCDELGHATSTADGTAIAWAVAEELASRGTYALFATHFPQLRLLADLQPNVQSWTLQACVDPSGNSLEFKHALEASKDFPPHYGILLAAAAGMPERIVAAAQATAEEVDAEAADVIVCSREAQELAGCYDVAYRLHFLATMYQRGEVSDEDFRAQLSALQADLPSDCHQEGSPRARMSALHRPRPECAQ